MNPRRLWPAAIVGVLGITVLANVVILWAARDRNAAVVEPDYYRKALAWDSTLARREASETLGWRLDAAILDAGPAGARVRARLADRDGAPLSGAGVHVEAIHNADAGAPVAGVLEEREPGRYEGRLPMLRRGLWELRFEVMRGDDRFTASLRRDTEAPPAGLAAPESAP